MGNRYKQQPDGRYRAKVWDGTYKNGAKHYAFLTSQKSSRDLERIVAEFEEKRDKGLITVRQNVGIQEYALLWLDSEKGLSERATKAMYANVINVHLKPLAGIPFEYFNFHNIQDIINSNLDKPRTCQQIVLTLKQISKAAEIDKLLPSGKTTEIFARVQVPKYKAEEKHPLTNEQCSIVLNALQTHVLSPRSTLFVALIYFCGLRREEALALKISDVHSLSVTVDKALHMGDKITEIKSPKTDRGYRTIPLPPEAIPIIQWAISQMQPSPDGYLFVTEKGELMSRNTYQSMWARIENRLGFKCTAHIFRHTYCTRLCYESYKNRTISTKQIARLLGDTDKMVTEVYSHVLEDQEQTEKALVSVFSNSPATTPGNFLATNWQPTIQENTQKCRITTG